MTRIGPLLTAAVAGGTLILGSSGVAGAAPVTTGVTVTSTPTTTAPSGPTPSATAPAGTAPSGNSPTTTTPAGSSPSTAAPAKKPATLTGPEIWRIVRPRHRIDCAHAALQVQRVEKADAAASKRLGRWQTKQAADQKIQSKNAAKRTKTSSGKMRGFQKLEQDGQALIKRIDAKCSLTSPGA